MGAVFSEQGGRIKGERKMKTAVGVLPFLVFVTSNALVADETWKPGKGDWQLDAINEIRETFGVQSFDELIWADESTLWAIRPSFGLQQNLLANTVCVSIVKAGQPAGTQVSLKYL